MRYIVVGDPHGCLEEFEELLRTAEYKQEKDHLIVAGDIFDRGPDSLGVLRRIMGLKATFVMGNHDEKHLRYADHEARKLKNPNYKNPMKPLSAEKQEIQKDLTADDISFLRAAYPIYQISKKWVVVHAGMENKPLGEQGKAVLRVRFVNKDTGEMATGPHAWDQPDNSVYWTDVWRGPESVLYGHAVHSLEHPRVTMNKDVMTVGIDTGCCFGGRLTAAIIENDELKGFKQVKAKKVYKPLTRGSKD